ncbi:MAG: dihydrolipoamide acetyltransferase [Pseudomonadota bacterium]
MERIARTLLLALVFFTMAGSAFAQTSPPGGGQDGAAPAAASVVSEESLDATGQAEPEDSGFNRRLLTTEEHVNGLKEQVFRAKATLQLLKEIVIQGSSSGARAVLWHKNELGPAFTIQSVNYYLDGQSIYSKTVLDESLSGKDEFRLHDGPIPAGNHTIAVSMVLRGNGFGVFSYVDKYTFNVQSSYAFTAEDGKSCEVWIRVKERKGVGRSFVERPWVEYDLSCTRVGPAGM